MKKSSSSFLWILFTLSIIAPSAAHTQTVGLAAPAKKFIAFEAYVQHNEGANQILSTSGESAILQFGTAIYEATELKIEATGTVKFVTRQNCVVVAYGEGRLISPQAEKPWRLMTKAARFICPEQSREKFNFHGIDLAVQGETLIDETGRIFVINGSATSIKPMLSRKIYQYNKGDISPEPDTNQALEQYEFDKLFKVPREGEKLKKIKPSSPNKFRVMFGPEFGPSVLLHANGLLNHYDYSTNGPRLLLTFRDTLPGLMIGFHYLEIKSKKDGYYNSTPDLNVTENIKSFNLDAGYRFNFQRWWSSFVRAGVIWQRNEIRMDSNYFGNTCGFPCGFHTDRIFDYFGLTAAYGLDVFIRPSWLFGLGLYASAEAQLNQTVHPTTELNQSSQPSNNREPNEATNEHGFISNINGLLGFGILYEF
jgi:hypothetical protein